MKNEITVLPGGHGLFELELELEHEHELELELERTRTRTNSNTNKLIMFKARAVPSVRARGYKLLDDREKSGWSYRTFIPATACSLSESAAMQRWILNAHESIRTRKIQIEEIGRQIVQAEKILATLGGAQ